MGQHDKKDEGRLPGQHHGDLRRALLEAALVEIEASDGAAPSLRAVARRANVSPGAPYHHFKGKDGLMAAVAVDGFEALRQAQREALALSKPEERLETMSAQYVRFAAAHPTHYRIMFAQSPATHSGDQAGHLRQVAMESFLNLAMAVAAVAGKVSEAEVRARAHMAWSLAHGAVMTLVTGLTQALLVEEAEHVEVVARRVGRACVLIARHGV